MGLHEAIRAMLYINKVILNLNCSYTVPSKTKVYAKITCFNSLSIKWTTKNIRTFLNRHSCPKASLLFDQVLLLNRCHIVWTNLMPRSWILSDSKVHGANMGPTWVLSVPDGPNVGPINLAIRNGAGRGMFRHWPMLPTSLHQYSIGELLQGILVIVWVS